MRKSCFIKKCVAYVICGSMLINIPMTQSGMSYVHATEINIEENSVPQDEEESAIDSAACDNTTEATEDTSEETIVLPEQETFEEETDLTGFEVQLDSENPDLTSYVLDGEKDTAEGTFDVKKSFEVLELINKHRTEQGLHKIAMDLKLYKTAQLRAKEIVTDFSHIRPDGSGCFTAFPSSQVSMGENLAQGYASASSVVYAWMEDSAHRDTILNSKYKSVGIACYYLPGSKYCYYWTQCFGDKVDINIYLDGDDYTTNMPAIYNGVDYSAVFNYSYYVKQYPELAERYGNSPEVILAYFVKYGMKRGHVASAEFNIEYYKNRYVGLRNLFGNNLKSYYIHYIKYGKNEGRDGKTPCSLTGGVTRLNGVDYSAVFNFKYYIANNEEVAKQYANDDIGALTYFVQTGMKLGHRASAGFDVNSYACKFYDLRKQYKNDLEKYYKHYMEVGKNAGWIATGVTVMQGGPTVYNGVDYKSVFSVGYYANKYPKLKALFGYDDDKYLTHFVKCGMKEGRFASSEFNVVYYKNRYVGLRNLFGKDWKSYYIHYIKYGKNEGRDAKTKTGLVGSVTKLNGTDYSAVFDYQYYIANNEEVAKQYTGDDIGALMYFVETGMKEGHQAIESFCVDSYACTYYDLRKLYKNNLPQYYFHYMKYGKNEGRQAVGETILKDGPTVYEKFDYQAVFNVGYYANLYPKLKELYGYDDDKYLTHFVKCGMKEGRRASEEFHVKVYRKRYQDLDDLFGDDLMQYYFHYINFGKEEGRIGN
ncbi:MAG: CAP domain-containing protein [Lachnospiraceae bacterium]